MGGKAWWAALAAVAAQPAAAAELFVENRVEQRSGAFAGATLTLGLDGSRHRPARARLGLGIGRIDYSASRSRVDRSLTPGVGLALDGGRPHLLVGGSSLKEARTRLGLSDTTTTLLVLGGVAVAVVGVMALSDDDNDAGPCPIAAPC